MPRIWEDYFEDLYNITTQEQVAVNMCGFEGVRRGTYFGREPITITDVRIRVRKLKNGKASAKDEVSGAKVNGGGDMVRVVLCLKTRGLL